MVTPIQLPGVVQLTVARLIRRTARSCSRDRSCTRRCTGFSSCSGGPHTMNCPGPAFWRRHRRAAGIISAGHVTGLALAHPRGIQGFARFGARAGRRQLHAVATPRACGRAACGRAVAAVLLAAVLLAAVVVIPPPLVLLAAVLVMPPPDVVLIMPVVADPPAPVRWRSKVAPVAEASFNYQTGDDLASRRTEDQERRRREREETTFFTDLRASRLPRSPRNGTDNRLLFCASVGR